MIPSDLQRLPMQKELRIIIHEKGRFVQRQMENQKEFLIRLSSVREVEEFVNVATSQPFPVYLDDGAHRINGKSFMEMFCLSLTLPLRVIVNCPEAELRGFRGSISKLLIVES